MPHWRIVVHALDRTGPPVLARSFIHWLRAEHPDHELDVVAFRGGELLDDLVRIGPVRVVLDPEEPWDWRQPDERRVAQLADRTADLPPVDATLLVSVSAGQALPFLGATSEPIVTWGVEQGEDLHRGADGRTARWISGSKGTYDELVARVPEGVEVWMAPEFVERPAPVSDEVRHHCRIALGARDGDLLVVGAGIATVRKAPDLFLEAALAYERLDDAPPARFVWLGGERDHLFHQVREESIRLGLERLRFFGGVVDVVPFSAAADVMLHAARLDSFPVVCLRAAAVGTPVVGFSNAGGIPEMFGDAFVGAPFPDIVALTACVHELADPVSRARAGEAQRAAVLARNTADVGGPVVLEHLIAAAAAARATSAEGGG
jgi:glycosyltransferase involved in cell wall biosynthesis